MLHPKIVVLGTGGTIAGTARDPGDLVGYTAAQLGIQALLQALPALADLPLEAEQVAQLDSKDMDFATWQRLVARCAHWLAQPQVQGIVITHGTDTLEETAYFLQQVLAPSKPVAITCAMRPATAPQPDGPQNLLDAFTVARTPGARGVLTVCAGQVHGAIEVAKVHPTRLDAFSSGEAGPLAVVQGGVLRQQRDWPPAGDLPSRDLASVVAAAQAWPRVEIVMNYAGAGGAVVDALVASGVHGLVAAGTGNGTLSEPLLQALLQARAQGVRVVRATRCAQGAIAASPGHATIEATGLSPVKARVQMLLELLAHQARS